ncbi:MAG: hypothetical protein IPK19_10715 [Chloroflexi bacterium]|nr:hypothetical protein [Chloroflexota bacterium]
MERSKTLGEQSASPHWQYRLCLARARLHEIEGDLTGALEQLDEAERRYVRTPVPNVRPVAALKTRVWLAQGRLSNALRWAKERELSIDDDLSYLHEFEHVTLARVFIAQYRQVRTADAIHGAVKLLERLLQAAEAAGRMGSAIKILVLQALAYEAQGDIQRALHPLERALTLAEPEGYVRILWMKDCRWLDCLMKRLRAGFSQNTFEAARSG